jgi:Lrp/AsnC family leucine-responsive transcriptional regulator
MLSYVSVKLEKRGRMPVEQFTRSVQGWSEVVACYSMTGDMDYLMRVQVEDLEHYSRFIMERLLKQPGVIDIRSNFVLERIKDTTALPLAHLAHVRPA